MKHLCIKQSFFVPIIAAILASAVFLFWGSYQSSLIIKMSSTADSEGQVFVAFGKEYAPKLSEHFYVSPDGKEHTYNIQLNKIFINSIRVDPATSAGKVAISKIEYGNYFFKQPIKLSEVNLLNDLTLAGSHGPVLVMESKGKDPYFDFSLIGHLKIIDFVNWAHVFLCILYGVVVYLILRTFIYEKKHLLLIDSTDKETYFYVALVLGFISFLFFNLNLSSLPEWRSYVDLKLGSSILFGESRGIRSDEWLVQTPYYASQILNDFSLYNSSIGPEKSTLLAGVPVANIYGYAQPRFWGFYLAGFDYGLSWLYAFRLFGLLFSSFLVFKLISKNDFLLSIAGSFWITFSSFTQWWFGSNLPDMIIGAFFSIFAIYSICYSQIKARQLFYGVILFFSSVTFLTALYPPFQIPLGYLSLITLIGLFVRDNFKKNLSYFKFLTIAIPILLSSLIILDWLLQSSEVIKLVLNSVYPGHRVVAGGDLKFYQFISGYLGPLLTEIKFPIVLGNVCEASNFYYSFTLLFLSFCYGNREGIIRNPLNICLFTYLILILIWCFLGYGQTVAAFTKMSMSPPNRALIGLGIVNIFLSISVFSSGSVGASKGRKFSYWLLFFIFFVAALFTYILYIEFPNFLNYKTILITFCLISFFGYSFLYQNKTIFMLSVFFAVSNGMLVNPIVQGGAIIHDSALGEVLRKQGLSSSRKWIVFSDLVHPQYLKAQGEKVFNGTKFMPDLSDMEILDPSRKYQKIWYRYSHLLVLNDNKVKLPEFQLKQTDVVILTMDVCSQEIRELKITNVAFMSNQDLTETKCIEPINEAPIDGLWLYSIK